jgi:hypothetical protein
MFTFNSGIPAANNNPSVDQTDMLGNNQSTDGILNVDHISFNANNGGQHKQVTFNNKNVPGTQTDPQSVLYTNNITVASATNTTSASTVASLFFRNQNSGVNPSNFSFPVSMIKAFGCFDGGNTLLNGYNIGPAAVNPHPSAGVYNFDIPANVLTGSFYSVFIGTGINSLNPGRGAIYQINSAVSLSVAFRNFIAGTLADPNQFSILILQL